MPRKLQALFILLSVASNALASLNPREPAGASEINTIQANTALAPLAVRGRIVDAKPYGQPRAGVDQFRVVADVEETFTFEGAASPQIVFAAYRMTEDAPIRQRDIGKEMLLFLRPAQLGQQERRDCDGCGWELDDDIGMISFIHLSRPVPERVLGDNLDVLSDPDSVLAEVRSVSGFSLKDHSIVQVGLTSDRIAGLFDDGKLAERARRWSVSTDPDHRSASIDLLRTLTDADSKARLVHLLKDPYLVPLAESCEQFSPWTERDYLIRQRAWDALQARNVASALPFPPRALTADPGLYHSFSPTWAIACAAGVLLTIAIGWFGLSRLNRVGRWWIASAVTAVIVCGIAAVGRIWLVDLVDQSNRTTRCLTFAQGELIFRNYLSIDPQSPNKKFLGLFRIGRDPPNWHDPTLANPAALQPAGFSAEVHVVPLWAALFLPLLPASAGLLAWKRRRIRLRTYCCVACGYDLRASTGRCPECGKAIVFVPRLQDRPIALQARLGISEAGGRGGT